MNRTPVNSSSIAAIGYDPSTLTLEIEFRDGAVYQYFDVPSTVYEEFSRAESKGRFLHANIRDRYRYTRS